MMLLTKEHTGLMLIDVQTALAPLIKDSTQCIERCAWLMKLAHTFEVPVMVCEQYPKGLGHTVKELNETSFHMARFSKVSFSCFADETIKASIQSLKKTQWILMGIETHVCVLQTAIDLLEAGYGVYVVVDATSSRDAMDKKYGLKRMQQHGAELITSEMVFFEWIKKAGTPEFKTLSQTFLKKS